MALSVLQANLNHCARAQDLLVQSMAEWLIDVAVVAEPYAVPARDSWVGDREGVVAVFVAGSVPLERPYRGQGYAAASVGDLTVVGVYFSPNRTVAEFERFLDDLGAWIGRSGASRVLVAGDFNAKSTAWGSSVTDARGEVLDEWAIVNGLLVCNRGSTDTCVRQQGGSIVDITFTSRALVHRVRRWRVLEDVETLSDHRYIRFSISASSQVPGGSSQSGGPSPAQSGDGPRWALKRLDREAFAEAALVQAWLRPDTQDVTVDVEEEAERLNTAMVSVCDAAMPRSKPCPSRRKVYWWSDEIAASRRECVAARRQYTRQRRRRVRDAVREEQLYSVYREKVRALKAAIGKAKADAWAEMLGTLDRDPWGRPYKVVRRKLRPWAPPVTRCLQPRLVTEVVATLFPDNRGDHRPPPMVSRVTPTQVEEAGPEITSGELGVAVARMRKKNTAPGPDGIPGRAWVLAMESLGPRIRALFDECLRQGQFPRRWRSGRLVLLRKEGRAADSPSAYRPIVLLDEVGKLFERVIAARLTAHLEAVGPDLSETQFGFRRRHSTIDALSRVKAISAEAVSRGEVVVAVSLDIANAFNTLPWGCIEEGLRYHRVPPYLRRLISSYLGERTVEFPRRDGRYGTRAVSCGVPQGSVLGPLLWNVGYDWVLRGANLSGVAVTCYADDTLVTARGADFRQANLLATAGTALVVGRIRRLGLHVALEKSRAICFHGPRRGPPAGAELIVSGTSIGVGKTMRYLGVVLDSRWKFRDHFVDLAPRLVAAARALGGLLPNLGGPDATCRRLYTGVVRSMALYGAPIWAEALTDQSKAQLRKAQRVMAVRVIRGYRTVSCDAACVLAGTLPWELEAVVCASVHEWRVGARRRGEEPAPRFVNVLRETARRTAMGRWRDSLETATAGRHTVTAIRPVLTRWVERAHGSVTFRLTQVLTGHGCFGKYLCRIAGREPTAVCHHCGHVEDTAQHTLESCPAWASERRDLSAVVGTDVSLPALIIAMLGSETAWNAVVAFCEAVISQKEAAERERETTSVLPIRRRRTVGRRRFVADLRPP